ncbi:MAG: class I SAM-dependent methyltransferase [Acidobacteria bacterium]|nr:class I SAM-dependent methyltransferase [Acidobacteriota bacterium]
MNNGTAIKEGTVRYLVKIWSYLPANLRLLVVKAVQRNNRLYRRLLFRHIDAKDRENASHTLLPPAELRHRVSCSPDAEGFVMIGAACVRDIQSALSKVGRELGSFERILDFGCGCGRTLIQLAKHTPSAQIDGTDIDPDAIAWCRAHLTFARFSVGNATPPTGYQSDMFDFIYAISVFTHLNEDYQFRWLGELRRIARDGAILLLTVDSSKAGEEEFVFENSYEEGLFPAWYQNAFHSRDYVFDKFSSYFNVLGYYPRGMNNHQDVVLLQKSPAS